MNKVLLTGRLTRDPELRSLASGSSVATFAVATNEYRGSGKERAEYHNVVVWDRLAQVCGQYLGKGQMVAIEGRLQTRQWEDRDGNKRYTTEVVAETVRFLGGGAGRGAAVAGEPPPPGDGDAPPAMGDDDIPF